MEGKTLGEDKMIMQEYSFDLNGEAVFEKVVYNFVERDSNTEISLSAADKFVAKSYEEYKTEHIARWSEIWEHSDVEIEGDNENQQGIRFCIFNMHQTYHGDDGRLNVGAKGLTGEKYSGWTFWDTETYCLPFYMFNNVKAAKNLLMYRYNTLKQAKERAIEQDCEGACYPMVTIDGTEYAIRNKCDYRVVLDVISALNDEELEMEYRIECALFIFYEDLTGLKDIQTAITEMMKIINLGEEVKEEQQHKPQLMDWEHDF